jgi:hypothetical protein
MQKQQEEESAKQTSADKRAIKEANKKESQEASAGCGAVLRRDHPYVWLALSALHSI